MGALGFIVTPELDIFLFQCDEGCHGIRGAQPTPNGVYTIDLAGEFLLTPALGAVEIRWLVNLAVTLNTPAFLDFLPAPVVERVGNQVLTTVSAAIGERFLDQLLTQYHVHHHS